MMTQRGVCRAIDPSPMSLPASGLWSHTLRYGWRSQFPVERLEDGFAPGRAAYIVAYRLEAWVDCRNAPARHGTPD